ncbi:MAG: CcdB family protein [Methylococcaceae bacterium]|jgi:toxin CcdB
MAQLDYFANTDTDTNKIYPFMVDVQDNLLSDLNSRVVIPLTPLINLEESYPKNLCPIITIEGKDYALLTHQISSISKRFLSHYQGTLAHNRPEIIAAIDFLITGI